jgi:hypothetical protein
MITNWPGWRKIASVPSNAMTPMLPVMQVTRDEPSADLSICVLDVGASGPGTIAKSPILT